MFEVTPQRKQLLEELYALDGEHIKREVREDPDVYETSIILVMKELVHTWESNWTVSMVLEEASYPERLQAAREFLEQERETVSSQ